MQNTKRMRKYMKFCEFIEQNPMCSKQDIIRYMENELDELLSIRTFERMKNEVGDLGYDITYHNEDGKRGYTIEKDESVVFANMDEYVQHAMSFGFMVESLEDVSEMKKLVRLTKTLRKGLENLPGLMTACLNRKVIKFDHLTYQTGESVNKEIKPLQLREYQGRWYVVGLINEEGEEHLRSFGVDRIENLVITKRGFRKTKQQDPDEYYAPLMGMWSMDDEDPVKVVLEVDAKNWRWIDSLPWHDSQKLESEKEGVVKFSLLVKPTLDLQRRIMQWAPEVKVLKPVWYRNQIKKVYADGLSTY
ncbi:WYL domain-containing protein [bacterium]|nr:WYL domain-containing protein [bacterium]